MVFMVYSSCILDLLKIISAHFIAKFKFVELKLELNLQYIVLICLLILN